MQYSYTIVNEVPSKSFHAEVKNPFGKVVFEIEGYNLFQDGIMKHKMDVDSLAAYLVDNRILNKSDQIIFVGKDNVPIGRPFVNFLMQQRLHSSRMEHGGNVAEKCECMGSGHDAKCQFYKPEGQQVINPPDYTENTEYKQLTEKYIELQREIANTDKRSGNRFLLQHQLEAIQKKRKNIALSNSSVIYNKQIESDPEIKYGNLINLHAAKIR